jgi:hypothetical protein
MLCPFPSTRRLHYLPRRPLTATHLGHGIHNLIRVARTDRLARTPAVKGV